MIIHYVGKTKRMYNLRQRRSQQKKDIIMMFFLREAKDLLSNEQVQGCVFFLSMVLFCIIYLDYALNIQ